MNLNRSARNIPSTLKFEATPLSTPTETVLISRKSVLSSAIQANDALSIISPGAPINGMMKSIGKTGKATTFLPDDSGSKFTLILLPEKVTRNNHPLSPHTITDSLVGGNILGKGGEMVCKCMS